MLQENFGELKAPHDVIVNKWEQCKNKKLAAKQILIEGESQEYSYKEYDPPGQMKIVKFKELQTEEQADTTISYINAQQFC